MYNRYLRNDRGEYTCIPQEEPRRAPTRQDSRGQSAPPHPAPPPHGKPAPKARPHRDAPPPPPPENGTEADGGAFREGFQFLDKLLEKLHLQDLDSADLMLLLLLFFLFEAKADDELLIALGLLLIL